MKSRPVTSNYVGKSERDVDFHLTPSNPSREFIVDGSTYEEIYRLAAGIKRLNQSSDNSRNLICLCTDNKALIAAAIIASLAGGPLLILPYAFSKQAIDEVCTSLSPAALLTDRLGDFPNGYSIITPEMLSSASMSLENSINPNDPFLILFTGGSTGKPQAWPKTPRNLLTEAQYQSERYGINGDDIFLSTAPPQHIYGLLFSILMPLICSSRVLEGTYSFPREILRAAQEHNATILVGIPPCYRVMKTDDLQRHNLRMAFSSAGALREEDAKYFFDKTGLGITEIYGSTETGGVATRTHPINDESWTSIDPVEWKISDGQLLVRSPFLSPTLPSSADGFFVTSDHVEYAGDDKFILCGRVDDIIKIGGKRVDLNAVQAKLKQIRGVKDAVVVSYLTRNGRQNEMVALVVSDLDMSQLRHQMAATSEAYAIPRRIIAVKDIPVTSTGKYNRKEIDLILQSM
jgi:acyl-coenzyme A synthetase/AMP-(fatty) acid ligase